EHSHVDGEYTARRADSESAARALGVPTLRDADPAQLDELLGRIDDEVVRRRARHVITEIQRVREFDALLAGGTVREHVAELGARMTGGGFGGSTIALVEAEQAEQVASAIASAFAEQGFASPEFFLALPSEGAGQDR